MLKPHKVHDRVQAINAAKAHLASRFPTVVEQSEINAQHIAGDIRQRKLEELRSQLKKLGIDSAQEQIDRSGLAHDHWLVQFFPLHAPDTASSMPPTMVRVYDADGRVEY